MAAWVSYSHTFVYRLTCKRWKLHCFLVMMLTIGYQDVYDNDTQCKTQHYTDGIVNFDDFVCENVLMWNVKMPVATTNVRP